jgi:predicted 3-demethylubiquinone-9 3-methyltransferase (glyoxalase superfamily)
MDRYGLRWQIVPAVMDELMSGGDLARRKRVSEAMMKMVKLDIAALQAA